MTPEQIADLTPDELRMEIARRLGYTKIHEAHDREGVAYLEGYIAPYDWMMLPDWCNDISAAWELIDQVGEYSIAKRPVSDGYRYHIRVYSNNIMCSSSTEPLEVIICRAWLMWKAATHE